MAFPNTPAVVLPDPATRTETDGATWRAKLTTLLTPYKAEIEGIRDYLGYAGSAVPETITARVAALESGGVGGDGTYYYNFVADFQADPTGAAFSDTAMTNAINTIRLRMSLTLTEPNGVTLFVPRGYYKFAQPWNVNDFHGITIHCEGTQTNVEHNGAVVFAYTGTGPRFIDGRGSHGLVIYGAQVSFTNANFAGTLVDFGRYRRSTSGTTNTASVFVTSADAQAADAGRQLFGTGMPGGYRIKAVSPGVHWELYVAPTVSGTNTLEVAGNDGAYNWFVNGNLRGIGTRGAGGTGGTSPLHGSTTRLLGMAGSIFCGADRVTFMRAGRGVDGCYSGDPALATYSNANYIMRSVFQYITQAAIWNPGQGWTIDGNGFEAHQDIVTDDMPAVSSDVDPDRTRSSGVHFTANWCGDGCPPFWLNFYQAYGWTVAGNYMSKIGAHNHANANTPYMKYRLSGGHTVTGNELSFESTTGTPVHPPIFDGASNLTTGRVDGAVRGIVWLGNKIKNGSAPTNYAGLTDLVLMGNDWPTTATVPGNGFYVTDSDGSTVTSGGGGSGVTVQDEGVTLTTAATAFNFVGAGVTASGTGATKTITIPGGAATAGQLHKSVVDHYGFPTDGSVIPTAAINALKADMEGRIIHWPPAVDYNLANLVNSTANPDGTRGFQFREKPTHWKGPGVGLDQAAPGYTNGRLLIPAGVVALKSIGNGQQGGPTNSRLEDLFFRGPQIGPFGVYEAIDGLRIESGSFMAINVLVEGFGRDNWSVVTNDSSNANNTVLIGCKSYFPKRHGIYLAGTNSNAVKMQNFDTNNAGNEGDTTVAVTIPAGGGPFTLTFAGPTGSRSSLTERLPSSGRGTFKVSATQWGFITWTGKTTTTLTGCQVPAAFAGVTAPVGSRFAFGFGMFQGGQGDYATGLQNGGFCNTADTCHGSFNAEGVVFDESGGNLYLMCYVEDTVAHAQGGPFQGRMLLSHDAHDGMVLAPWFGGFRMQFASSDGVHNRRSSESLLTAAQKTWWIRQPTLYPGTEHVDSGRPILSGATGGNVALNNLIDILAAQSLITDATT